MNTTRIICFEDAEVDNLRPITLARPAYAVTSASFRLLDWLKRIPGTLTGHVRPHLNQIQELDYELETFTSLLDRDSDLLLINARIAPTAGLDRRLQEWAKSDSAKVVIDAESDAVLIAFIPASDLTNLPLNEFSDLLEHAAKLPASILDLSVFRWPHDVIQHHMKEMATSMNWRLSHEEYTEKLDGVFTQGDVKIGDYPVVDTSDGPILLNENVQVGPFCYLSGPVFVGTGTRVIEHAALKDGVSLGHTVKIGGEVEASIIEPYTNKQHHGFLGHSYLGSWINLGAGTCNSDLKNTYGKINIHYGNSKIATGMQFLGCFMGDYSKTAINTSIFTGKVIGVCSMMYGFVTSNVPSYVNYARLFGQTSLLPADVMINTQKRMFARRKVAQRECDRQLIRDMYDLSCEERESADQDIL
ncbi:putative sugar nucleotidyl transferase [bacterium]|nr:putative sugar nucleotidyl transferase [Rhodopirellula sp.]MDB4532987.1 putative sugar nucleotidyl transferase [bacterium]MDB4540354.1 putative sugar nucleotidyl transferase [bacterium]